MIDTHYYPGRRGPDSVEASPGALSLPRRPLAALLVSIFLVASAGVVGTLPALRAQELPAIDAGGGNPAVDPTLKVAYALSRAEGKPGEVVVLLVSVRSVLAVEAASVAINFDESLLRVEEVRPGDGVQIGLPATDAAVSFNNLDRVAGDQTEEGWIFLEFKSPAANTAMPWPQDSAFALAKIAFRIRRGAPEGFTPVFFTKIGPVKVDDQDVVLDNTYKEAAELVPVDGKPVAEEDLQDGGVIILGLGEIGFFYRGDVNLDFLMDISDPVRTLRVLFEGQGVLPCADAADSNDDGEVDVSDPVFSLQYLYGGGSPPPEPEKWGPDPTPDRLCCEATGGCS